MRIKITADSATPDDIYRLTLAFQRTANTAAKLPEQLTTEPTVKVLGIAMTWTSPAMDPLQVPEFWAEHQRLKEVQPDS